LKMLSEGPSGAANASWRGSLLISPPVRPKARAQAGNAITPSREAMLVAKASSHRSQETCVGIKLGASVEPSLQMPLPVPFAIARDGVYLKIPPSRQVRALLAYLSLAPHASTRSQSCELLWDVPNDPRGELRWCLSKIRAIVDDPDR